MSEHAAQAERRQPPPSRPTLRETVSEITGYWWVGLVAGIAWLVISLVILQFDKASITTVGVLVGLMFLLAAVQNIAARDAARRASLGAGAVQRPVPDLRGDLLHQSCRARSPGSPTCSVSCSCSSASGGWSRRSWSGRSTRCGGSG